MTIRPVNAIRPGSRRRIAHRPEEVLQRHCVQFLRVAMPAEAVWWHTPNQRGTRSKVEAQILKTLGVKPGIPDLLLLYRGRLLAAELKAPGGGKPTDNQRQMHEQLRAAGCEVLPDCRSLDQLAQWLTEQGVPLRAVPAGLATTTTNDLEDA